MSSALSSHDDAFQFPERVTVQQLDAKSRELGILSIQEYEALLQNSNRAI